MTILVIGHTGALGSAIYDTLVANNIPATISVDDPRGIANATPQHIQNAIREVSPRIIVNCIAKNGLDACYTNPVDAFQTNAVFPELLASAAHNLEIPLIHFSTEAVFACSRPPKTYRAGDTPKPTTVYGMSKAIGERKASLYGAYIIRLPLLYGPTNDRQIIAKLTRQILAGETIRAAIDVFSTPVYTPEVVAEFMPILRGEKPVTSLPKITHMTSGQVMSIYELMFAIASNLGINKRVNHCYADELPALEPKPQYGGLEGVILPSGIERYARLAETTLHTANRTPERHVA